MLIKSPKDIVNTIEDQCVPKSKLSTPKLSLLSFLAGVFIAFGGLLAIKIGGGVPSIQQENPGLASLIFGAVFPVGLVLVVIAGAELFTGNTALWIPGLYKKRISWQSVWRNLTISYLGNFIGSLFVAYFLVYTTDLFNTDPWLSSVKTIAESKTQQSFWVLFSKAIGCNWLVCLAVWIATAATTVSSKVIGVWFPIMAFVAIGFEHSVANMFFIPLGIFYGADVAWADFFINNLIPVTLGNIVGGAGFVGCIYAYIFSDRD